MIDVNAEISTAQRRVGEIRTVTLSKVYDTTVEDLWDACTNRERIPRWFLPISGDLHVGGRYELEGNAGGIIESCDPPHSFSATWEYGGEMSRIAVRLTPEPDDRARLTLDHSGHADDDKWTEFGPGAVGVGWDLGLLGLGLHLASGRVVDPTEIAAWMGADEGKQFVTLSSQRWRDAHIAAGAPPADARAAADRTTAAYTGGP